MNYNSILIYDNLLKINVLTYTKIKLSKFSNIKYNLKDRPEI